MPQKQSPELHDPELEAFRRELPLLLQLPENRGKYALVHAGKIEDVLPTLDEALTAGYERFGLERFLCQEITDNEKPLYFSRNVTPWH